MQISGGTEADVLPILGRILNVEHENRDVSVIRISLHPEVSTPTFGSFLLLQWVMTKAQSVELEEDAHDIWQINNEAVMLSTRGIQQGVHTNCLI